MLRARQLMRAKFRRQHPIGPFIVDFFCKDARLVVEADGAPTTQGPCVTVVAMLGLRPLA